MTTRHRLLLALALLAPVAVLAAEPAPPKAGTKPPPQYLRVDQSTELLIDHATAQKMWAELQPPQMMKLYPVNKWGLASEVNGGFDDSKTCVVTARAMILPRRGPVLVLQPKYTSVSYGSMPAATQEQCQALAKAKLKEAIGSVMSSVVAQK